MAEFRYPNRWTEVGGLFIPDGADGRRALALLEERDRALEDWTDGVRTEAAAVRGARIYRSTVQSLPDNTDFIVTHNQVVFDTDGYYDPGDPTKLTIPVGLDGFYLVTAIMGYSPNGTGNRACHVYLNGSKELDLSIPTNTAADDTSVLNVGQVSVDAGDELQLGGFHRAGVAINSLVGRRYVTLAITRLGAAPAV